MLALLKNNKFLCAVEEGGKCEYEDMTISPCVDGWEGAGGYKLLTIQPADPVPMNKISLGEQVVVVDGKPKYTHILVDIPKETLIEFAAEYRWQLEVGGIDWNGYRVDTNREAVSALYGELAAAQAGLRKEPAIWKFSDGAFVSLTNAEIEEVAAAVSAHISLCFETEAQVVADINDGLIVTKNEVIKAFNDALAPTPT